MDWLLDGGLVLMQMVNYQLVFHYKNCTNTLYMMLDPKIGSCKHIQVPAGSDKWGPIVSF